MEQAFQCGVSIPFALGKGGVEECDLGLGWGLSGGSSEVDRILGQKVAHLQRAWVKGGCYPGQRS